MPFAAPTRRSRPDPLGAIYDPDYLGVYRDGVAQCLVNDSPPPSADH